MKAKPIIIYALLLGAGMALGWWLFGNAGRHESHSHNAAATSEAQVWTCSMHPQIRQDKPGKCPICAMNLIPLKSSGMMTPHTDAIVFSDEAAALANIQTTTAGRRRPVKEMRLYGTIQPDEHRLYSLVSHVNGRIEKLAVNFIGETVQEGQVIATVYSPDLQTAQQELLEAVKMQASQPALLAAAREKLRLWKLTDAQIEEMEQTGKVLPLTDIVANVGGVVTARRVAQGDYVAPGSVIFELADLSVVWALFEAYVTDLPYLRTGNRAEFTTSALPGQTFSGQISFIEPSLDALTRTVKVRVKIANPRLELKPGMYVDVLVHAALKQYDNEIVVPKTAVMWTGKRSIVYVKQQESDMPSFLLREVELGPSLGDAFVVLSGIDEGEQVVTNGVFSIDASAQLEGKPSMMNDVKVHAASLQHAILAVQGLCDMCKARIESTAKSVAGVSSATWDAATQQLHLSYAPEKDAVAAVSQAVSKTGHDTEKHRADDKSYSALPECCRYRNNKN
ncbi:MAG: efflux RND transporter periplasmic adaptor subunit [Bacteroidales bacterium]|nr:efflux RND transporter periplasmic adaptor subunit [Bacteroidales bacterium]